MRHLATEQLFGVVWEFSSPTAASARLAFIAVLSSKLSAQGSQQLIPAGALNNTSRRGGAVVSAA